MSKLLWSPTKNEIKNTQAWEFIQEVNNKFEINLDSFRDLYQWSCNFPESFWGLFWSFSSFLCKSPRVKKFPPCCNR